MGRIYSNGRVSLRVPINIKVVLMPPLSCAQFVICSREFNFDNTCPLIRSLYTSNASNACFAGFVYAGWNTKKIVGGRTLLAFFIQLRVTSNPSLSRSIACFFFHKILFYRFTSRYFYQSEIQIMIDRHILYILPDETGHWISYTRIRIRLSSCYAILTILANFYAWWL